MDKCPKIGDRVRYRGGLTTGPCVGTVTAIYETHIYDEDALEAAETDEEIYRAERGLAPECEWHVAMKPDKLPDKWAYPGNDQFAPEVKSLVALKE